MTETDPTWYQQALVAPQVIEANVRIGVIPTADHVQTYWEVKDPTNGVLLAAGAVHHTGLRDLRENVARAVEKVLRGLEDLAEPF